MEIWTKKKRGGSYKGLEGLWLDNEILGAELCLLGRHDVWLLRRLGDSSEG